MKCDQRREQRLPHGEGILEIERPVEQAPAERDAGDMRPHDVECVAVLTEVQHASQPGRLEASQYFCFAFDALPCAGGEIGPVPATDHDRSAVCVLGQKIFGGSFLLEQFNGLVTSTDASFRTRYRKRRLVCGVCVIGKCVVHLLAMADRRSRRSCRAWDGPINERNPSDRRASRKRTFFPAG